MAHLFTMKEWQGTFGEWVCGDVEDLANNSNLWYIPARILGISPADFVLLLINEYHADVKYVQKSNLLLYSWKKQEDERKFKNFINAKAREKKAII